MHLSQSPPSLVDIIARDGGMSDLAALSEMQKSNLFRKLGAVMHVAAAGRGSKGAIVASMARTLGVSKQSIHGWLKIFNDHGWRGLVDGRGAAARGRAALPKITREWIKDLILRSQRNDAIAEVHRQILDQWRLWRRTGDPQWAIPGFRTPPQDSGKGYPAGFSYESFRRCAPTAYQASLARQGTIASYRQLPSILSTCIGTEYLEYVFFDDEKPDVNIRVLGYERPMVPLCFHALDRLTRYPFRPHIRLRWFDADKKTHKHLTQKEFVWYVITLLIEEGYRTDARGTTLIQEHGTAKLWENLILSTIGGFHSFEDALKALTARDGMPGVRIDSSGLFNKPAFRELIYGPQSSGNPRFKAPIESSFRLWRTYSLMLRGQTGRNVEESPEENYGITKYEKRILKNGSSLPPAIQDGLISNYLTGLEFGMTAELIREGLANRDDHDFEGWGEMGFAELAWRWAEDPVGMWRTRRELAALPEHIREHALDQQRRDPLLSTILPWTPAMARESRMQDPCITRLNFADAIHLLPTAWAKEVTVRDHYQIHITEDLLPGEELIYLPELTTPRGRTEYLQPGDKLMCFLNPLQPDTLLVCDQKFAFLGTVTRNVRIGRNDDQVTALFEQRARLKATLDAPVRRAMQPVADRRDAVRRLNDDLIARTKEPDLQSPDIRKRAEAAEKGRRTRAGNNLDRHANDVDWDAVEMPAQPSSFDALPDDEPINEAF